MPYGVTTYGSQAYGKEIGIDIHIDQFVPELMTYLPQFYQNLKDMKEIQSTNAVEIGALKYAIDDQLKQYLVETATWGLDLWERDLGLVTDPSKTPERRREIIRAKLRGFGTTTKEMIKRAAAAFSGGEVEVIEYPSEYRFEVQFIGVKGIPANMAAFIQMLEEIKPAHLGHSFKYSFSWWGSLSSLNWQQAHLRTWNELRVYEGV